MGAELLLLEPWLRLGAFAGVFALVALWEVLAPRRPQAVPRTQRWPANIGMVVFNTLAVRVLLPLTAVAFATQMQHQGTGLLPWLGWGSAATLVAALVLLDLAIYLQHRLFHAVPWLWRLHRMHHADTEFDVTNGLRFHTLEILLSMGIKFAAIAAIGAPPLAVLLFELVLSSMAMFNHGNIHLPPAVDRVLRRLVVTPDMHRIHHSVLAREHHRNFGFNLPWWDHLLGTYRDQPEGGQLGMTLGLSEFRTDADRSLAALLRQPFTRPR